MPVKKRSTAGTKSVRKRAAPSSVPPDAEAVVASLRRLATKKTRDGMGRFGIPSDNAFGVTMPDLKSLAKRTGRSHELAGALWGTGWYEARMLCAFVDDPAMVSAAQMDRWAKDFDSWAICDTICFHLFDRTPHAFGRIAKWANRKEEFVKRAAFALLASVALHDKQTEDGPFAECLPLIERAASDDRNFVKKGVSWGLRGVGHRSAALHASAVGMAEKLAASPEPAARWVGRDVLKDLNRPMVRRRLSGR